MDLGHTASVIETIFTLLIAGAVIDVYITFLEAVKDWWHEVSPLSDTMMDDKLRIASVMWARSCSFFALMHTGFLTIGIWSMFTPPRMVGIPTTPLQIVSYGVMMLIAAYSFIITRLGRTDRRRLLLLLAEEEGRHNDRSKSEV